MIRTIPLALVVALTSSGCGLVIDGAYLLSDKHSRQHAEQRRPTEQAETRPERQLAFEGPQLRVACEEVTRQVERVWTVEKKFEYQGGFYQAHWLPVLLEGVIGSALAIGIGAKCTDPSARLNCNLLYGTIPFAVDVSYSLVRLLTIDPPKLVDKTVTGLHTEPAAIASSSTPIACDSETTVVASDPAAQGARVELVVGPTGWLAPEDQARLLSYALTHRGTQVALFSGGKQVAPDLGRCELFRRQHVANPGGPSGPADCLTPPPSR